MSKNELEINEVTPNFIEVSKEEIWLHEDAKRMIREAVHKIAYEEYNNGIDPIEIVRNWSVTMFAFEDSSLVFWAEIPGVNSDLQIVILPNYWGWRVPERAKNRQ